MPALVEQVQEAQSEAQPSPMGEAIGTANQQEPLARLCADQSFIEKVPIAFARKHLLLGIVDECGGPLRVLFVDRAQLTKVEVVGRLLDREVVPVLLEAPDAGAELVSAINAAYESKCGQVLPVLEAMDRDAVLAESQALAAHEDLLDVSDRAPVIKLVNLLLFEAIRARASDVHVQPYEHTVVARSRIDGILEDAFEIPKPLQEEVLSRIKVMGRMNIAEKRLPQDGRATVDIGDRSVDLRIATLPTAHGERAVLRLLEKGNRLLTLTELGMDAPTSVTVRQMITAEHGIVLVTGPTGSGKTTTLYAALRELNHRERNIITIEDPIEYQLQGISQTQVSEKKGLTFASALRSVLRQDPDVIMVGEIRDRETAVMAIQSSLTGHFVFSTLHTNDAPSAVARLLDLGIEPFLVTSSLIGVVAQRLARRICAECGRLRQPTPAEVDRLRAHHRWREGLDIAARTGCAACRGVGLRGRIGLFEVLHMSPQVQALVHQRASSSDLKVLAAREGMRTLAECGLDRVVEGVTTFEEVDRVTIRTGG